MLCGTLSMQGDEHKHDWGWWKLLSVAFVAYIACSRFLAHSLFTFGGLWSLLLAAYLPSYLDTSFLRDGHPWPWFKNLAVWGRIAKYFDAEVHAQEPLDHTKQYIFCQFPHGACSVGHVLSMTDACGFMSQVYNGPKRDLGASILFMLPVVRELLLWFGCVDAGGVTVKHNLRRGRSLLLYVGGEKEQLLTEQGHHRIYISKRKGIIRMALSHGVQLVPLYCWGENDLYTHSRFLLSTRQWLVANLRIGLPIFWGPLGPLCPLFPFKVKLTLEVGKPIAVPRVEKPSDEQVNELLSQLVAAIVDLFEQTKAANGYPDARLEIF